MSEAYMILSRVDLAEGGTWRLWEKNLCPSEETILGVYKTPAGAYDGIQEAISKDRTKRYFLQSFCSCCGKYANNSVIWFDPDKNQLFGVNG